MKKLFTLSAVLLFVVSLFGQKKDFSLEETFLKASAYAPENLKFLQWIPGTTKYCWVKKIDGVENIYSADAAFGEEEIYVSLVELNDLLSASDQKHLQAMPKVNFMSAVSFSFQHNNGIYFYDHVNKTLDKKIKWIDAAEDLDFSKNLNAAYTKDRELFVSKPGDPDHVFTSGTQYGYSNGKSAYRNEFGISKGTFWSPSGKSLAYYRMDETMVTEYPIMDLEKKPAVANMIRYPMAGQTSHVATVMVLNTETGISIALKSETIDNYLTNISWSPDEKYIYMAELNRDQNFLSLNQYDAATGAFLKKLFEERDEKYVEPERGLFFIPGSNSEFIWISERNGFDNLYLYNTDGKLLHTLSGPDIVVMEILGFDEKGEKVFFSAATNKALDRHLFVSDIKSGKFKQLTADPGTHNSIIHPSGKFILDIYASSIVPREIRLLDGNGKLIRSLLLSKNPLSELNIGETNLITLKADDGTDLNARIILPVGFDPANKYPVLVYVYGGPHLQMVTNSWMNGAGLWMHYLAQKGYIVFSLDNRGSANRGRDFEQALFRNFGTVEVSDQMKGIDYLKSQSYVDGSRLAVFGWSYGGFMTTSLMLKHPGVFKAAVAGGPVMDWKMYEIMYTERYMDTPQKNESGYENSNMLSKAKELKGKLMLIHGTSDDTVLWQHSLSFLQECVNNGVMVDYFVYPGHGHNVMGKDRVHLHQKVLDYIFNTLE